jgi:hypothetical protein
MKKLIDIEKLVSWAVRDELPKGQAVAASPWDIITQFCALGVRVQTSGPVDGYGFTPGAPHEDALAVAEAVRALANGGLIETADVAAELFGDLLPIAGEAVSLILLATFDARSIVISNATMGSRPKWKFEHPTPYQRFLPSTGGRPRELVLGVDAAGDLVELKQNRGRAAKRDGVYSYSMSPRCPISWGDPSVLQIAECRAEYVIWRAALTGLVDALRGTLKEFEPTLPAAAALPWVHGVEPVSRVVAVRPLADLDIETGMTPRRSSSALPPIESPIEAETVRSYAIASRSKMRKIAAA